MEFHVSKEHVRRESRKAVYLILFLTVVSTGLVAKVLSTEKISDLFFPIIGLLVFVPPIFGSYKRIREGKAAYPVLELDEPNGKVAVLHKDIKVIVSEPRCTRLPALQLPLDDSSRDRPCFRLVFIFLSSRQ